LKKTYVRNHGIYFCKQMRSSLRYKRRHEKHADIKKMDMGIKRERKKTNN
jgi:hypothetical protein